MSKTIPWNEKEKMIYWGEFALNVSHLTIAWKTVRLDLRDKHYRDLEISYANLQIFTWGWPAILDYPNILRLAHSALRSWTDDRPTLLTLTYELDGDEYLIYDIISWRSYTALSDALPKLYLSLTKEGIDLIETLDPTITTTIFGWLEKNFWIFSVVSV